MFDGERHRAAVVAHVRVYDVVGRRIGGLNSRFATCVLDIHESERFAYELGLYLLTSTELHDALTLRGFPNRGVNSVIRINCFYDRQDMFRGNLEIHGPVIDYSLPVGILHPHVDPTHRSVVPSGRHRREGCPHGL